MFDFVQTGSYGCQYEGLDIEGVTDADNTAGVPEPLIVFNQPNGTINGAALKFVFASNNGPAIKVVAAASPITSITTTGGYELATQIVDSSGNFSGQTTTQEPGGGIDHTNSPWVDRSTTTDIPTGAPFPEFIYAPSDRWFNTGSSQPYATLASDPYWGQLFGDGSKVGFTAQLQSASPGVLSVGFAKMLPPTSFSGTAATGGSLAAGTYYAVIYGTANTNCNLSGGTFSTWAYATGVVVDTWTLPASSPVAPVGYCISINTTGFGPGGTGNLGKAYYISGGSTASFAYTGQTLTSIGNIIPYATFVKQMNFTYNDISPVSSGGASLGAKQPWASFGLTNCSNGSSPATCGAAAAGAVAIPTGTDPTLVIDTSAVTASSEIKLQIDESVTITGVTCNTSLASLGPLIVTARTPGTSFTIESDSTVATNPVCVTYEIVN
jgi:hypothetical protein